MPDTSHSNVEASGQRVGSVYTPSRLAQDITDHLLTAVCRDETEDELRLLDPSCGDGEFLLAALQRLTRNRESRLGRSLSAAERIEIVDRQLFGVDVDPEAILKCRERLRERLHDSAENLDAVSRALVQNIRCGDALTGPGFEGGTDGRLFALADSAASEPLDWKLAFPEIARTGGFDVVVGNPPYVRERDARELFAAIAASPLGHRRQARMDLWYYFLHRGLDLLKPGGTLSFIVNSYWIASTGATRLIERLSREVTFEQFIEMGSRPVFPNVAGRHHIFRLRKAKDDAPCHIIDLSADKRAIEEGLPGPGDDVLDREHFVKQTELFDAAQIVLSPVDVRVASMHSARLLGDCHEVRQGMAENPPTVTRKMEQELQNGVRAGDGVFVLDEREVEKLALTRSERKLLRPYFPTSSIGRYQIPAESDLWVLYLTRQTAESLDALPTIAAHLERLRPILERRRETQRGINCWWHLHWPREERIFVEPRILAAQMGKRPQFVFTSQPAFVGFAMNVILGGDADGLELSALAGILNSRLAERWFERFAKRRGVRLEIGGTLLRRFPLPPRDADVEKELTDLVSLRHQADIASDAIETLEQSIEILVCRLYGIDAPKDDLDTRQS